MLISPSFLVKILCYTWKHFTIILPSSAIIYAGPCLVLKILKIRQRPAHIIADETSVMVKDLHV